MGRDKMEQEGMPRLFLRCEQPDSQVFWQLLTPICSLFLWQAVWSPRPHKHSFIPGTQQPWQIKMRTSQRILPLPCWSSSPGLEYVAQTKVMRNETLEIPATLSDEAGLDRDPEHLSLQSHSLVPTEKPHSPRVGIA